MSDLIRRQDAINVVAKLYKYESDRMTALQELPTVEAKPVVHGEWVHGYNCSECGCSYMDYADADAYPATGNPLPNFCGNCGADMRKKVE